MPKHPDGEQWAMLPRGLDTSFKGWRSPYFGNRAHWVHHNAMGPSWFMGPAEEAQPELQAQVKKLLVMSAKEIATTANSLRPKRVKKKK